MIVLAIPFMLFFVQSFKSCIIATLKRKLKEIIVRQMIKENVSDILPK